jgi:hypothetical protein
MQMDAKQLFDRSKTGPELSNMMAPNLWTRYGVQRHCIVDVLV